MVEKTTLADIFNEENNDAPEQWDVTWIKNIKVPAELALNQAQATLLLTETARAIEWCGEKISILLLLTEEGKNDYENEWTDAYLHRAKDKTAATKKVEADGDPVYMSKKARYTRFKSYLEYFKQKQSSFLNIHNAMKEIIRSARQELPMSGWGTTDNAYKEKVSE